MLWPNDLQNIIEVCFVSVLLFWMLPKAMFPEAVGRNAWLRFFGRLVRMLLLTAIAVVALSSLNILNAATLATFYALVFFALWARRHKINRDALQNWLLARVASVEEWHRRRGWEQAVRLRKHFFLSQRNHHMIPVFGTGMVVFLLMVEIRLWWPLHDLRFAYPDAYPLLLRVRELLHDTNAFSQPLILPSMLAAVASLSAVDAMQVTRFLPPIADILLAIVGGVAMAAVFRSNWVGILTTFILGCYAQKSVVSEGIIGVFFLLLGIALVADYVYYSHRASLYDALCSLLLLGLAFPRAFPHGIALTLLLSCVVGFVARFVQRLLPAHHFGALLPIALMVGVFLVVPPLFPHPFFLEYETTARQSLRIASIFPEQHWAIVAPTEQFSETLGMGQYQDLYRFVDEYQYLVEDRAFTFPQKILFVFVEKNPFKYFPAEPSAVSFSILTDPTYRNYRSPAGRSSVELAALKLCEVYSELHPNSRIFYEDENLRIYQFTRD